MWCGNAAGDCLPPMVGYKAQNIHKDTVYQCTKSGWFDSNTFEEWFMEVILEYVQKNPGWYVLFGDNLASHFNVDLVRVSCHAPTQCNSYTSAIRCSSFLFIETIMEGDFR